MGDAARVHWSEDGEARSARWRSERGAPPPKKVVIAKDTMTADDAYGLASQGIGLLWRGDFQNARQMLTALAHRADRPPRKPGKMRRAAAAPAPAARAASPVEAFNAERQARAQRARTLGMLLIPMQADYSIPLRRAPDLSQACTEAYGPGEEPSLVSLRELLGVNGAHEWRRKGIGLESWNMRIHPHYGVFAPVRSEYVDLVAKAPVPAAALSSSVAFDIGTGTGVGSSRVDLQACKLEYSIVSPK